MAPIEVRRHPPPGACPARQLSAVGAVAPRRHISEGSRKCGVNGSIGPRLCRYPPRDAAPPQPPPYRRGGLRCRSASSPGTVGMSALPAGDPGSEVLVPHWLTGAHRVQLATAVRRALTTRQVHPVAAIGLEDVLTELHVAAARDAVWPASTARVRLVTGWGTEARPGRPGAADGTSLLALPTVPAGLRARFAGSSG